MQKINSVNIHEIYNVLIFLSLLFFYSCANTEQRDTNGFTKKAVKTKEYLFNAEHKTKIAIIKDTLSITEDTFNAKNRLIKKVRIFPEIGDTATTFYEYRENGLVLKEINLFQNVEQPIVSEFGFSKKEILNSESFYETESYFSITKEKIFIKDTLKQKSESLRVFLDKETNDTIMKLFISTYFNDKNRILKIDTKNFLSLEESNKIHLTYKNGLIHKIEDFDNENNLSFSTIYKYELDKHQNWIKRKRFENDTLKYISHREVFYK